MQDGGSRGRAIQLKRRFRIPRDDNAAHMDGVRLADVWELCLVGKRVGERPRGAPHLTTAKAGPGNVMVTAYSLPDDGITDGDLQGLRAKVIGADFNAMGCSVQEGRKQNEQQAATERHLHFRRLSNLFGVRNGSQASKTVSPLRFRSQNNRRDEPLRGRTALQNLAEWDRYSSSLERSAQSARSL